jgi:hypothetical protein
MHKGFRAIWYYLQAVKRGDNLKAKACIELLEKEIMDSLADPNVWKIAGKLS